MEKAKVQLSEDELRLMQNSEWILTKNRVIEKISIGLGELVIRMQDELGKRKLLFQDLIEQSTPKISRGEKYQGLPYVMLDYPRIFHKEDILAIRTLFWWGNFCSITLHTKGRFTEALLPNIMTAAESLQEKGFYISMEGNEWNHDLTSGDYKQMSAFSGKEIENEFDKAGFLKLSAKIEFGQWDTMGKKLLDHFIPLLKLVQC